MGPAGDLTESEAMVVGGAWVLVEVGAGESLTVGVELPDLDDPAFASDENAKRDLGFSLARICDNFDSSSFNCCNKSEFSMFGV